MGILECSASERGAVSFGVSQYSTKKVHFFRIYCGLRRDTPSGVRSKRAGLVLVAALELQARALT